MNSPQFPKVRTDDAQQSRVQDSISAQLQPIANALAATPIMGAPAPAWLFPDLKADFAVIPGGYAVAAYHRDALGYVHGKGAVYTPAGIAGGTTVYTLPIGYRPKEFHLFASVNAAGATALQVGPDGTVVSSRAVAAGGALGLEFVFLAEW